MIYYVTLIMQSTLILLYVPSYRRYLLKDLTFSIMLKKEEEFAFDFNKAINASVDDEKLYASLSHLIWSKLISNEYLNIFQRLVLFIGFL